MSSSFPYPFHVSNGVGRVRYCLRSCSVWIYCRWLGVYMLVFRETSGNVIIDLKKKKNSYVAMLVFSSCWGHSMYTHYVVLTLTSDLMPKRQSTHFTCAQMVWLLLLHDPVHSFTCGVAIKRAVWKDSRLWSFVGVTVCAKILLCYISSSINVSIYIRQW